MPLAFDIAEDELDILLAETDEQIQILNEGVVQLERAGHDPRLLQALFRAAHTLKGEAGMINHWRLADLTHALETVLDGLLKGATPLTTELVDTCLETLDVLKLLHGEIVSLEENPVEIAPLVERLQTLSQLPPSPREMEPQPASEGRTEWFVVTDILPESLTPAARAFQVMLALQTLGEVRDLQPTQAVIESAAPVRRVSAYLLTDRAPEAIQAALEAISEVAQVTLHDRKQDVQVTASSETLEPAEAEASGLTMPRLRFAEKTVRTSVERLDTLMNLVGELITDRNRLGQIRGDFERQAHNGQQALADSLAQTIQHLGRITDQLQEEVMHIRLLPVGNVFGKFPRLVRDLARKTDKQIEVVIHGEDTELDRSVIEEIGDPLIHLVRNAVDHGLELPADRRAAGKPERGVITLTARHEENRIILTIEDDGRGIDLARVKAAAVTKGLLAAAEAEALTPDEALDLIFLPGLSTSRMITDVSGRGVGMDIVRTNIERLNGSLSVETWPGRGTRFQIVLPLTLVIVPTLLVELTDPRPNEPPAIFAIPLSAVMETLRLPASSIYTVRGKPVTQLREHILPLVRLNEVLDAAQVPEMAPPPPPYEYVVAVRWGKLEAGLLVNRLVGEQELVVKSLGALVGDTPGIFGAAILGDGRIALIIDVLSLFKMTSVQN